MRSSLRLAAVSTSMFVACSGPEPAPPPDRTTPFPRTSTAAGAAGTEPFGLTSSDGEGLAFVQLQVAGVVQRPLAYTELRMTFENPTDRIREGRFEITLPPGGSVARFAMRLGDRWQEGEMVERRTAQRAYDDFLHRRQDPALLEHEAGNSFSARVFPIAAHSRKDLILSYSQEMAASEPYRVPLRGLPGLGKYSARILAREPSGDRQIDARQENWVPDADLIVEPKGEPAAAVRAGRFAVARVKVPGDSAPAELPSLALLVDSSASRAKGFDHEVELVQSLVGALPPQTPLLVAAFDQDAALLYEGPASDFKIDALVSRRALGATDLRRALQWLSERLTAKPMARALVVSDGVSTAGAEGAELTAAAAALAKVGVQRLDAVAVGGIRDDAALARLARAGFAHDGLVISGELTAAEILRRLRTQARSGLKVEVASAAWVDPPLLDNVQPGDEVLIHAELSSEGPLSVQLDGKPALTTPPVAGEPALVGRACAAARIASLQEQAANLSAQDRERAASLNQEMIKLSTTYRVSSPLTAFLVLETDADYQRYGIDRTSAGEIWTVGKSGLVSLKRGELDDEAREAASEEERQAEAIVRKGAQRDPPPHGAWTKMEMVTADESKKEAKADAPSKHESMDRMAVAAPSPIASADPGENRLGTVRASDLLRTLGSENGASKDIAQALASSDSAPAPMPDSIPAPSARVDGAGDLSTIGGVHRTPATHPSAAPAQREPRRPPPPPPPPPPSVSLSLTSLDGPAQRGPLEKELGKAAPALLSCYRAFDWSKATAPPATNLEVRLAISAAGIDRVGFSPPIPESLASCLTAGLKAQPLRERPSDEIAAVLSLSYLGGAWFDYRPGEATTTIAPWAGKFGALMAEVQVGSSGRAVEDALVWHEEDPGEVLALLALGEAAEATGDLQLAARAYGSIIDLFPSRADLRRLAGNRLDRVGTPARAADLAIDTYRHAVALRPDHPSSHHLLGMALLRAGRPAEAFEALASGAARTYPSGRFAGAPQILAEDLGLAAAAWKRLDPRQAKEIEAKLAAAHGHAELGPSLRFVLTWETDDNDVDFHIHDRSGAHAFYGDKHLPSGGDLYADVTTGYGPECFTIRGPAKARAYPYWIDANYYSRGPMGFGMGKIDVIDHDGSGGLTWDTRPFVVMADHAFVDEGKVEAAGASKPKAPDSAPSLPAGACPAGEVKNEDTAGNCCWPGQSWNRAKGRCVGEPTCPPGLSAHGEACANPATEPRPAH